jgi:hypothetical protein
MKKVIELLEGTRKGIIGFGLDLEQRMTKAEARELNRAIDQISEVITKLKAPPRWETPEQWNERTGEDWPDDWAVYSRAEHTDGTWSPWQVSDYAYAKCTMYKTQIVCATEAGKPPENWKPERAQ